MDCCGNDSKLSANGRNVIALIGHHNVGKSVLFNRLTGRRVTVSNYPGTTVEVTRGPITGLPEALLLDTPGILTFPSHTEDERATSQALLEEPLRAILQVGDAKNLSRTLLLTLRRGGWGLPLVLPLNRADEAEARGVRIDSAELQAALAVRVVPTIAVRGQGLPELEGALSSPAAPAVQVQYPRAVEAALRQLERGFPGAALKARGLGLLWLCGDPQVEQWLADRVSASEYASLAARRAELETELGETPAAAIQPAQLAWAQQ